MAAAFHAPWCRLTPDRCICVVRRSWEPSCAAGWI